VGRGHERVERGLVDAQLLESGHVSFKLRDGLAGEIKDKVNV
jgi:hypothetical protein